MREVLNVWVCDGGSLQSGFISSRGRKGGWEKRTKEEGGKDGGIKRQREGDARQIQTSQLGGTHSET